MNRGHIDTGSQPTWRNQRWISLITGNRVAPPRTNRDLRKSGRGLPMFIEPASRGSSQARISSPEGST